MTIPYVNNFSYVEDFSAFPNQVRKHRSNSRRNRKEYESAAQKCAQAGGNIFESIKLATYAPQESKKTFRSERRRRHSHSRTHRPKVPPPPPTYPYPINLIELLKSLNLHESNLFMNCQHLANSKVVSKRPGCSILDQINRMPDSLNWRVLETFSLDKFLDFLGLQILPPDQSVDVYYSKIGQTRRRNRSFTHDQEKTSGFPYAANIGARGNVPKLPVDRRIKVTRSSKKGGSEQPFFIGNEESQRAPAFPRDYHEVQSSSLVSPSDRIQAPRSYKLAKAMHSGEYSKPSKVMRDHLSGRRSYLTGQYDDLGLERGGLTPPPLPLLPSPVIIPQPTPDLPKQKLDLYSNPKASKVSKIADDLLDIPEFSDKEIPPAPSCLPPPPPSIHLIDESIDLS